MEQLEEGGVIEECLDKGNQQARNIMGLDEMEVQTERSPSGQFSWMFPLRAVSRPKPQPRLLPRPTPYPARALFGFRFLEAPLTVLRVRAAAAVVVVVVNQFIQVFIVEWEVNLRINMHTYTSLFGTNIPSRVHNCPDSF